MEQTHKKLNTLFALVVLLVSFTAYIFTVSPTVAFWDCGEYIGAAHSLGIPHPPGNPLYVLLGRVFSMIFFFFEQVAFRVNIISVVSSAVTAMLIYLIIVRTMVSFIGIPDNRWKRLTVYVSGVTGALFAAFSYTFWFNAVEASVYNPSMMIIALCTWLALVWYQRTDSERDRVLLLFSYLAFLGIGIHMFSMIALVPVFLFVMLVDREKLYDWRLWLTALLMGTVIYQVSWFFFVGPIVTLVTLIMSLMEGQNKAKWRFCFWVAFFALVGYSVHFYIPIRSALNPMIDENHPVIEMTESGIPNWEPFKQFLERKQYGSESMITRMFWRRGAWSKQFGFDGHMGYGGFHLTQFFHFGKSINIDREASPLQNWGMPNGFLALLVYLIPTFLMIFGWGYLYKRNKNVATLLIFAFLITSVALVLYMNFADGHHPEKRDYLAWVNSGKQGPMPTVHREVRIRDYFFTPGFMFMGMWIGIAAGAILHGLFNSKKDFARTILAPMLSVLFIVSPVLPLTQNYMENNRKGDWVPYDYAYNLLMSCEKDGILFTNGDNDTFPLWFLQEAEGIRRDVRIVNLSLLNTQWYIKQLKNLDPKVPISFSETQIDGLTHEVNPIRQSMPYRLSNANVTVTLPGRSEKNALRVQDKMVLNIVDANKWRKPIYFAVTVSNDNMMGLQSYLQMEGLVYRVLPQKVNNQEKLDMDRTLHLLDNVYRFRGLGDGSITMNETTQKLMSNYAASFIQVALELRQPLISMKNEVESLRKQIGQTAASDTVADTTEVAADDSQLSQTLAQKEAEYNDTLNLVINKLDQCVSLMPWDWRPRALRQEILLGHGKEELALKRIEEALMMEPDNLEYIKMKAQILDQLGKKDEANALLRKLVQADADQWETYAMLAENYAQTGQYDSAVALMKEFQQSHPGDRRASMMIRQFEQMKQDATRPKPADTMSGQRTDDTAETVSQKE
ncbi:MAG: protein O-mannosyl-transferase family [Chitinispirillaceae bacterium]